MDLHGLIWLFLIPPTLAVLRFSVPLFLAYRKKQRLVASGIAEIDTMDGREFEQYLQILFRKLGYQVQLTRYVGDYGADLIVCKDGVKIAVQAKRWRARVGIKAVQEAVAAKGMYGCAEAMVVTNSTYTKAAWELARANRVMLWDRGQLVSALLSVHRETPGPVAPPAAPVRSYPPPASSQSHCAFCGSPVSENVRRYCLSRRERFGGRVYCFPHQKLGTRHAA